LKSYNCEDLTQCVFSLVICIEVLYNKDMEERKQYGWEEFLRDEEAVSEYETFLAEISKESDMRHEDYPCCGCGPEGCIDYNKTVKCQDCGQTYHPDQNTEKVCYRCQAEHQMEMEEEGWDRYCEEN